MDREMDMDRDTDREMDREMDRDKDRDHHCDEATLSIDVEKMETMKRLFAFKIEN
jgi:hypothetical protein